MSDMTLDPNLDRELRDLFGRAPATVQPATVEAALARAALVPQRRPVFARLDRRAWPPKARSVSDPAVGRALRVLAIAAILLLLGALVAFGARLLERPPNVILDSGGTLGTFFRAPSAQLWPDGRILVTDQGSGALLYDPGTGASSPVRFPSDYASNSVTVLPDGRVLLIGNADTSDGTQPLHVGFFDVQTGDAVTVAEMQLGQFAEATLVLRDGRILVSGGTIFPGEDVPCSKLACEGPATPAPSKPPTGDLATVEILDPATGATSELAPLRHARWRHQMIELDDGRILIVGGNAQDASPTGEVLEVEVYDIARGTSEVVGRTKPHVGPFWLSPVRLADGRVFMRSSVVTEWPCGVPTPAPIGSPNGPFLHVEERQYSHVFDPRTNTFVDGPLLPHFYGVPSVIALPDGRALMFGSYTVTPGGCATDEGAYSKPWLGVIDIDANRVYESYNPETGLSTLPIDAPRIYATGVLLPDGRVALIGDTNDDPEDNPVDLITIDP